jgi:hypothetical protein
MRNELMMYVLVSLKELNHFGNRNSSISSLKFDLWIIRFRLYFIILLLHIINHPHWHNKLLGW